MERSAESTIAAYYEALRGGASLSPFFLEDPDVVKIGVGERLVGYAEVADGLSEQTATTDDWTVESNDLRVTERERHAWFSDRVYMAWRNTRTGTAYEFDDTRWTGTLERRDGDDTWRFVGMHVSCPVERASEDDLFAWDD